MDPNLTTFDDICKSWRRGYTFDTCRVLENATITHSTKMIYEHTEDLFQKIGVTVGNLTIGKTYLDNIPSVYKKKGLPYMMVVAMATQDSIPDICWENGSILDPEEYAVKLKDRLLLSYYGKRIYDKGSVCGPGGARSGNVHNEYVVYVAFNFITKTELLLNFPLLPLAILPPTWLCKDIIIIA